MENNFIASFFAFLMIFSVVYVIAEAFPTRKTPATSNPLHTLTFADGSAYEVAHSTTLWVYAGSFWQKATLTAFEPCDTQVMFALAEGGFAAKRYSCGSWRFMPFDEIQKPNFVPVNPRRDAAKLITIGEFYG